MDLTTFGKLVTMLVLAVLFAATVLITPRLWSSNRREKTGEGEKAIAAKPGGRAG